MIAEDKLVPYHCSELPPGPWLVVAPHADDETFGMGGTLLKARAQGIRTALVVMTDGALGGSGNDLVAVRKAEALQAASMLGLSSVTFLGEPDRGLQLSETLCMSMAALIRDSGAATVFFPGVYEPHPDHRATALLVWEAMKQITSPQLLAVAYEISVQNPLTHLIDISAEMPEKRRVMALYASQLPENNYVDIVVALNKVRTFSLPAQVEFAEGFYYFSQQERAGSLLAAMTARLQAQLAP